MSEQTNQWAEFDSLNHMQPEMASTKFDSLHSWDLGWELLEPINLATSDEHEIELSKQLSPAQKALYFFWYLDGQVSNGGFIQFYWNGYSKYLPAIRDGLKLMGDNQMISLLDQVDEHVHENISTFQQAIDNDDFGGLYDQLPKFEEYDDNYYEMRDKSMELIEIHARSNASAFIKLK